MAQPVTEITPKEQRPRVSESSLVADRRRFSRRLGAITLKLPLLKTALERMPARRRPALYFESLYNIGNGAFICLFLLSTVVLETILNGTKEHLTMFAAMFGGSSLLSPLVSYAGRRIPMKALILIPNLLVAALLVVTALPVGGATFFALVVGLAFVVRVFPRVAEMNMFRVLYPPTHRGAAVGWVKAVAAISALGVTVLGYWWFSFLPGYYWLLYWLVAVLVVGSTFSYWRIPVSRHNIFGRDDQKSPHHAFRDGLRVFLADRRFVLYQVGFSLAGFANHMAMIFVAKVLHENVLGSRPLVEILPSPLMSLVRTWSLDHQTVEIMIVGFVFALLPTFVMMTSAPFWGRFLDKINPMIARSIFNLFQTVAYALHAYGGLTLQLWPMVLGATLHAIGNGGGTINWLTGSLYFARNEQISLYNAIHVGLTGLRGLIAPICGLYLMSSTGFDLGAGIFWVASALSFLGVVVMLLQGLTDPGPREELIAT